MEHSLWLKHLNTWVYGDKAFQTTTAPVTQKTRPKPKAKRVKNKTNIGEMGLCSPGCSPWALWESLLCRAGPRRSQESWRPSRSPPSGTKFKASAGEQGRPFLWPYFLSGASAGQGIQPGAIQAWPPLSVLFVLRKDQVALGSPRGPETQCPCPQLSPEGPGAGLK